ncbi:uronyl 2-sulfotransferase-like isoform X2 [Limulus polyphemus]|uniref:Uronyl 2-sulfotransferase-like isoform X2 n=1 Tax=Limulus polyphemus TaxID=6850 RepID=A0ABM1STA7_LIMPO|nr:uronyl 2-sulfotransferase-like isoform X2 [Limulus polyphemus]
MYVRLYMGPVVEEMVHVPVSFQRLWPICILVLVTTLFLIYTVLNLMKNPSTGSFNLRKITSGRNCSTTECLAIDHSVVTNNINFSFDFRGLDVDKLLYNRAPKCGSTTIYSIMQKLSVDLGYQHYNSKIYNKKLLDESQQRRFVKRVKRMPSPCSFDRHVFFVNFSQFGETSPLYINVVRDPVERIVSSYFYRRAAAKRRANQGRPNEYWMNKNFEQCVLSSDPECTFIDGGIYSVLLLPYFCGQDRRCLIHNHPWALWQAKQNIQRFYPVVGVLEDMNTTLIVLENTLPRFFRGAFKLYHNTEIRRNQNTRKKEVAEEIKDVKGGGSYKLYLLTINNAS